MCYSYPQECWCSDYRLGPFPPSEPALPPALPSVTSNEAAHLQLPATHKPHNLSCSPMTEVFQAKLLRTSKRGPAQFYRL